MVSKSEAPAPKKAPNVVSGPGPWFTEMLLPLAACITVQPVKLPVSKSPLLIRFALAGWIIQNAAAAARANRILGKVQNTDMRRSRVLISRGRTFQLSLL